MSSYILNCISDLQEHIYKTIKEAYYMSAGLASRHVVGFGDLNINMRVGIKRELLQTPEGASIRCQSGIIASDDKAN
jgi:hypothetical protein